VANKVCFVISPIGGPESQIRRDADMLLELVLEPALQKYDFDVVRADRIPRPAVITADIVELLQNADLCIIELTGENPNVYYECGRRHETRKPFIQLIRKGDERRFDMEGIYTVEYDCSTPYSTRASVRALQAAVDEFERSGYANTSPGVSLSSISTVIDRIERRLTQLSAPRATAGVDSRAVPSPSLIDSFKSPREQFTDAVSRGDVDLAASILPRLRGTQNLVNAAALVASAGHYAGRDELLRYVRERGADIDYDTFKRCLAPIVEYYSANDREREGLPIVKEIVDEFIATHTLQPVQEAFVVNQLQRITYGVGDYGAALSGARRALELVPENATYMYNVSLIYDRVGDKAHAEEMVDRYMACPGEHSASQLAHAVETYLASGRVADARPIFERLAAQDRGRAALLLLDDEIKQKLQT
jgi:tetratricopeptide (TPR) repeat protein